MSPYIAVGYSISLVTLAAYALSLVARHRRARRRLGLVQRARASTLVPNETP